MSVNEYVPELGGITSRYTRSSPSAGTLVVAANEQHVSELRSSVSCGPNMTGSLTPGARPWHRAVR